MHAPTYTPAEVLTMLETATMDELLVLGHLVTDEREQYLQAFGLAASVKLLEAILEKSIELQNLSN